MAWIILVGMMGSGKSTVGRLLAESLDVPFEDTDRLMQYRLGRPVHQLFSLYGEEAFRGHETALLRSLDVQDGVLATGGGMVLRDENWVEMRRLGKIVFLDVDPEIVKQRLAQSRRRRPLLEVENWEDRFTEILLSRRHLYEQADIRVEIDVDQFGAVVSKIQEALQA